jgi:hypothetical protein
MAGVWYFGTWNTDVLSLSAGALEYGIAFLSQPARTHGRDQPASNMANPLAHTGLSVATQVQWDVGDLRQGDWSAGTPQTVVMVVGA